MGKKDRSLKELDAKLEAVGAALETSLAMQAVLLQGLSKEADPDKLKVVVKQRFDDLNDLIQRGEGDLAASLFCTRRTLTIFKACCEPCPIIAEPTTFHEDP